LEALSDTVMARNNRPVRVAAELAITVKRSL